MATETFEFSGTGGYHLAGRLELPDTDASDWAVFAHCFTCGKDNRAAFRVARALAERGIGVLRFDFAGLGGSGGEFGASTFASNVADLVAAAQAMAYAGRPVSLLVGHSLGGAAVLAAAGELPDVRAVATVGAPVDVTHVLHQFDPAGLASIRKHGEADVQLGGRPFTVRRSFVDDLERHDLRERIARLRRALLILHSPVDTTVGVGNAAEIFNAAKHPKSFISLDDADHLLTRREDADYAAAMIATWAGRFLAERPAPT